MSEIRIDAYSIRICRDCIELKGEMCRTPECVFCWKSMQEVGEYLDVLIIRPVINGERLSVEYAESQKAGN